VGAASLGHEVKIRILFILSYEMKVHPSRDNSTRNTERVDTYIHIRTYTFAAYNS